MNEDNDRTSGLTNEKAQIMTDELCALPQHTSDIGDDEAEWEEEYEREIEEIIELSREPDPSWYEVAKLIYDNNFPGDSDFLGYSCWEELSDENSLPTETIANYLEMYFQMTALRQIPIKKYGHLPPDRVDDILKSLLRDEPTVPAIAAMNEDIDFDICGWIKWERELLASLKAG